MTQLCASEADAAFFAGAFFAGALATAFLVGPDAALVVDVSTAAFFAGPITLRAAADAARTIEEEVLRGMGRPFENCRQSGVRHNEHGG